MGTLCCVLGQNTLLSQVGMGNLMLGVTLRWISIPPKGKEKYSWSLYGTDREICSSGWMSYFACLNVYLILVNSQLRLLHF